MSTQPVNDLITTFPANIQTIENINQLPNEMIRLIFSKIPDKRSLQECVRTCQQWKQIIDTNKKLWEAFRERKIDWDQIIEVGKRDFEEKYGRFLPQGPARPRYHEATDRCRPA